MVKKGKKSNCISSSTLSSNSLFEPEIDYKEIFNNCLDILLTNLKKRDDKDVQFSKSKNQ